VRAHSPHDIAELAFEIFKPISSCSLASITASPHFTPHTQTSAFSIDRSTYQYPHTSHIDRHVQENCSSGALPGQQDARDRCPSTYRFSPPHSRSGNDIDRWTTSIP
jgi:hypothetical protein